MIEGIGTVRSVGEEVVLRTVGTVTVLGEDKEGDVIRGTLTLREGEENLGIEVEMRGADILGTETDLNEKPATSTWACCQKAWSTSLTL